MLRSSALLLAIAASAFALGSFSRGPIERNVESVAALIGGMTPVNAAHAEGASSSSRKGDRAESVRPAGSLAKPATVEVVGVGAANVILRDGGGTILYRSDSVTNTTLVAKDADIPSITVKRDAAAPAVQRPAPVAGQDEGEKRLKVGCEGVVSPLVNHEARRRTGRCLT